MADEIEDSEPRFSRAEYWIVEAVVDMTIGIRSLAAPKNDLEKIFNKTWHGLNEEELLECIFLLYRRGIIIFFRGVLEGKEKVFEPTREELEDEIRCYKDRRASNGGGPIKYTNSDTFYRLTGKGGTQWEKFAFPSWNRFISHESYSVNDENDCEVEEYEIISGHREHLMAYIKSLKEHLLRIEDGTLKEDIIEPWQATYWKKLGKGYRVKFLARDKIDVSGPVLVFDKPWVIRDRWYGPKM